MGPDRGPLHLGRKPDQTRLLARRIRVPASSGRVPLDPGQAHHLVRVLRARVGDALTAVDPSGQSFRATVASLDPVLLEVGERLSGPLAAGPALLVAPPKGPRMDWLVEKAVELGAGALWPVETERGVLRPGSGKEERWRRVAAAAAAQSGASLPEIHPLRPLAQALAELPLPLVAADPGGLPLGDLSDLRAFAIGPEGGWSEAERRLLEGAGARFASLGPRILRVETAAVAVLAAHALRR